MSVLLLSLSFSPPSPLLISFLLVGDATPPVSSASCNRDFTRRLFIHSRVRTSVRTFSRSPFIQWKRYKYARPQACARACHATHTHITHTSGTRNDPVNSLLLPLSLIPSATLHSSVATRGAFIYLRNTSRDSIWYMCMLAPLVARLFVHFIRRSFRPRTSFSFFLIILAIPRDGDRRISLRVDRTVSLCFFRPLFVYMPVVVKWRSFRGENRTSLYCEQFVWRGVVSGGNHARMTDKETFASQVESYRLWRTLNTE